MIDSGINPNHAEFDGRVERGWSVDGMDYCPAARAKAQHGTHVAGVLGGRTFGVAKQVKMVNVKAGKCGSDGNAIDVTAGDLTAAINWVTQDVKDKKVPAVVNISSIVGGNDAVDNAVKESIAAGATYVVAAGNLGNDDCTSSPAEVPAAITVAASTLNDGRWPDSNHGPCVDMYAPGENIVSADSATTSGSRTDDGTSFATPHVAGAAALILAEHPAFSPGQVAELVYASATYYDLESTPTNIVSVVAHYDPPQAPRNFRVVPTSDGFAQLSWDPSPGNVLYWVYQRDASNGQDFFRWGVPTDQLTVRTDALVNGRTYEFKVAATNITGIGPESNVVTARPLPVDAVSCNGQHSNWWNNSTNPWDPQPTQMTDVYVHGCITRTGGTVRLEFFWSTNGYELLDGSFQYDLRDCRTETQIWHRWIPFPNGSPNTTGSYSTVMTVDETRYYRMRVIGDGHININGRTSTFSTQTPINSNIRPTMAFTGCV